ncbi:hypothetical protein CAPTEDRAFT_147802 [Capitella teleta]|uniref:G-protein coupled receptors family 1 profile domain-containing protein n=1 Tax=Capitella teleta TaxID=283909 RepID=X1Z504_CAPTE|nr:hypothetical protein CAPTEDRAFT_147802 [Capitella teleta]|eukprot:ELT90105.1 hypothetical protein CAPTEDRAFT_147802 [Capitella teleta]
MEAYNLSLYTIGLENTTNENLSWVGNLLDEFRKGLYPYHQPVQMTLIVMYVVVFLLAVIGNVMVMLVILTNRSMRNVTNYFLLNLAVADLLVSFVCMPLTVGELVYRVWIYGQFLCKVTIYLQGVCVGASVLTIMCLSLDRYVVIHHPVKSRRISTTRNVRAAIITIWCSVIVIMAPLAVIRSLTHTTLMDGDTVQFCHEKWPSATARRIFDVCLFVFIYVIPGVVVLVAYSRTGCLLLHSAPNLQRQNSDVYKSKNIVRGRRRVAHMLLVLAVLFALSWMPYHAVSLYADFGNRSQTENSLTPLSFALLLGHSHSAQNPIVYCFMNYSIRNGMLGLLTCRNHGFGSEGNHSTAGSGRMNHQRQFSMRIMREQERSASMRRGPHSESPNMPLIGKNSHPKLSPMNSQLSDLSGPRSPGIISNGHSPLTYKGSLNSQLMP